LWPRRHGFAATIRSAAHPAVAADDAAPRPHPRKGNAASGSGDRISACLPDVPSLLAWIGNSHRVPRGQQVAWATPTTGSGGSRSSRAGRTGTGVWQERTADVSTRSTSWPPAIALPTRQGRSSRLAPGPDPGRRSPGYISGAPRWRCAGALPGRLPGRGSERLGCARGLAPLDDRHQRGELVTGRGADPGTTGPQPECAGTPGRRSFD